MRLDAMDAARWQRVLQVNVIGAFICAREAVRRMSTARGGAGGVIVNVSSAASRIGGPGEYVDYAASKGAIDTMTLGLAKEVAMEGIRVNAVRPGIIHTDIHASGGEPNRIERVKPSVPMQRGGAAEEVAAGILWLMSDEASYVTGTFLDITGGRWLGRLHSGVVSRMAPTACTQVTLFDSSFAEETLAAIASGAVPRSL